MTESVGLIDHRWSGWPGAWCLDCGAWDPAEECLSDEPHGFDVLRDDGPCPKHPQTKCPEPGSRNHDPYK